MARKEPVAELDARFSSEDATPMAWAEARRLLEDAEVYWLSTVRPDGRPHVTTLLSVWVDDALYICTGPGEQKAKNIAQNPHCILTTGINSLGEGVDLVVEGDAVRVTDDARLHRLADASEAKYGRRWRFEVRDGAFAQNEIPDGALVYEALREKASTHMKLTMTTFLTVDGVMQAPGGPDEDRSGGFEHGGWLVPYADEDMGQSVDGWFAEADAFLLGRKTYEIFAAHWPRVTDEEDPVVAKRLNSLPKHVASKTLDTVEWNNSTLLKGDVAEAVAALKRQPGNELQVHGSGNLAQTLIKHGLIDEYRLFVYPVVLGEGKRLFADGAVPAALKLVDAKTTSAGVTVNSYQPAGELKTGSFALED